MTITSNNSVIQLRSLKKFRDMLIKQLPGDGLTQIGYKLGVNIGKGLELDNNGYVKVAITNRHTTASDSIATLVIDDNATGYLGMGVQLNPKGAKGLKITKIDDCKYLDSTDASPSSSGMMSAEDKAKLDSFTIATDDEFGSVYHEYFPEVIPS